jgi:PKD repeat protein
MVLTVLLIGTSTATVNPPAALVQPRAGAQSTCWVDSFDNTENAGWLFTGASPYLHNDTASFIASYGVGNCSWFHFPDTDLPTVQNVFLAVEWKTQSIKPAEEAKLLLHNSVSEVDLGSFNLTLEYRWTIINVTATLGTISQFNNATLKVASLHTGLYLITVRRAYLRIRNGPVPLKTSTATRGKPGGPVTLAMNWADPDGLSSYAVNHNASGSWLAQNISGPLTGTEAWSNHTITLPADTRAVVAYRFWANDTNNTWEASDVNHVYPVKNFSPHLLQQVEAVSASAISHSYGRKDFYDNVTSRFWKFYSDGGNLRYTSSLDGEAWRSPQTVRSAAAGFMFYVHTCNGTVHYVYNSEKTGDDIYYRQGTLHMDGAITWATSEQVAVDAGTAQRFYACSIVTDTDGYPCLVFGNRTDPDAKTLNLIRSNRTDGQWQTATGFPKQINEAADSDLVSGVALSLPNRHIYVLYCTAGNEEPPRGRLCAGTTLGPLENASADTMASNYPFSAVADSRGGVHVTYRRTESRVDYSFRNYTTGQWAIQDELVTSHLTSETLDSTTYSWPVIGWHPASAEVHVHWWTLDDKSAWLAIRNSTAWEPRRRIILLDEDLTLIDGDVMTDWVHQNRILLDVVAQNVISGHTALWAYVYTNVPPSANFTESADTVYTGEPVSFDASASYDSDGTIVSHFWDFGDGTNTTGVTAEHAYTDNGTYTVTLTVTDDDDATDSTSADKTVLNRPPHASFTVSATVVYPTEPVTFNATESTDPDGILVAYFWDFGDASNTTGSVVTHAYATAGNFTATLTVTDDDGATANATASMTVLPRDVAVLTLTPSRTLVGTGFTVNVTATVANQGHYAEQFNLTLYANSTIIQTTPISLPVGNSTSTIFLWNTTGWSKGTYTLRVEADPVPGETDTADNTLLDGQVFITLPGDVDGDRDVDIFDIVRMSNAYGTSHPDPEYDPHCDLDGDGDIDIFDIVAAAGHYGDSW